MGGSPGAMECFRPGPLRNVVINEFLAHTDPPDYDYIELYNHANQPVDVSGCTLTRRPQHRQIHHPAWHDHSRRAALSSTVKRT